MLLIALFIVQATAEWVEISQQHYRKPLRTHYFTTPAKIIDIEETTRPWVYNNHSVSISEFVKDPFNIEHELKRYDNGISKGNLYNEVERKRESAKRVPNIGIVRRVQLSDSPPKSPIKLNRRDKHPYMNPDDESNSDRDNDDINYTNIQHNNDGVLGNDRNLQTTVRIPVVNKKNINHFNLNPSGNSSKNVFITKDFEDNEKLREEQQIAKSTESTYKDVKGVSEITKTKHNGQLMLKNEDKGIPRTDGMVDDLNTKSTKEDGIKQVNSNQMQKNKDINSTKAETLNTIETLMRFLTVVADTISKNSRRNFNGKIRYLQELKETILRNIADRIDTTWPDDDDSGGARRRSRSAQAQTQAEPRGHVQFPSSESSLMTISFLTFAVFLIKLVLQVIQTYKNKTMMVAPLVVAAGRAAFARHKHNN